MKRVGSTSVSRDDLDSKTVQYSDSGQSSPKRSTNHRSYTGAAKYKTSFNTAWKTKYPVSAVENDTFAFRCTVCERTLSCGHQGEADVKRHVESGAHQKFLKTSRSHQKISELLNKPKIEKGLKMHVIDLRSDTVTKPTATMRMAMAEAEVDDDVLAKDPTTKKLEDYAASIFGKEAALYFPTGTMGNLASVMAHCNTRGAEVILGDQSHIHINEQGGMAQIAGVHHRTVATQVDGTLPVEEIVKRFRGDNFHYPETKLICLENSHNICGGTVLPVSYVEQVGQIAKSRNVALHMDGARIFNASIHLGLSVATLLKDCDTVSACLSKGLGAPVGTIVAGDQQFINRALRCRKALGGGMRQVGVLAASGYVAMTSMVERLADDHRHTWELATVIEALESDVVSVNLSTVHTNILNININSKYWTASAFCQRLKETTEREEEVLEDNISVLAGSYGEERVRVVFHADVGDEDAVLAIKKIIYVIEEKTKEI